MAFTPASLMAVAKLTLVRWAALRRLDSAVGMEASGLDGSDLRFPEAQGSTILRLEGVNKWFHRGTLRNQHVLKDINLEVNRGEVLVVIGPSGSGKSTLLRCINFVSPPETGTVIFLGRKWTKDNVPKIHPVDRMKYERELNLLRTRIGMVFQQFNLFPHMTALQNVTLGLTRVLKVPGKQARERALAELERLGLAAKAKSYPSQLSGGQKQRVAIARALGDRLMFMDEGLIVEEGPAREMIRNPQNERTQAFLRAIL